MAIQMQAASYGEPDQLRPVEVDVAAPGPGQVTVAVRAAGVNPSDHKRLSGAYGKDPGQLPLAIGSELAGVLTAIGPATEIGSGPAVVGDEVVAFRVPGAWAEALTVPAADVFAKPPALDFPAAANLLLVGATAADMMRVVGVTAGETILVHGASGAVGVSLLQQAALLGARVIGTASPSRFDVVRDFAGVPVAYGDGLEQRVRDLAPDGVAAALDCVGTDEAVDVSLAVAPRARIVTIAAQARATADGILAVGGTDPDSQAFRSSVRPHLIDLAARGLLVVPVARTFPLVEAAEALRLLQTGHPGGKLALVP